MKYDLFELMTISTWPTWLRRTFLITFPISFPVWIAIWTLMIIILIVGALLIVGIWPALFNVLAFLYNLWVIEDKRLEYKSYDSYSTL